jgi:hypothetical protein
MIMFAAVAHLPVPPAWVVHILMLAAGHCWHALAVSLRAHHVARPWHLIWRLKHGCTLAWSVVHRHLIVVCR